MKIQFGHKRSGNFIENFYAPLKENFPEIDWIFPHLTQETLVISEKSLKGVDIFLSEVSEQATGLGIELGFARAYGKRIICLYRQGSSISSSLNFITNEIIEYSDNRDMIQKLKDIL